MPRHPRSPWRSLAALLPRERLLVSPATTALYGPDAQTAPAQPPAAVAFPCSAEEVVQILRCCHRESIPFVPRGNGTGLCGAACPAAPGSLTISLQHMDRVLCIDPADRSATVQPAVTPDRLNREARPHGLRYLPSPGCRRSATLGGNLAHDAAGPNAHLPGNTAAQILGAILILPDGTVAECGGAPAFGSSGPDPLHLLGRSEGRLGIVVELTLALVPLPESEVMLTAGFPSLAAALQAADAVLGAGLLPAQLELFDPAVWSAMTGQRGGPETGAVLWCTLEGPAEETAEERLATVALLRDSGAERVEAVTDAGEREALRQRRDGLYACLGNALLQDGAVPRSRLGQTAGFLRELEERSGVPVLLSLNAATGNLFPAFRFDPGRPETFRHAEQAALRFLQHCAGQGGSIAGCHGLGREKSGLFAALSSGEGNRFFHDLKAAFHPGISPPAVPSAMLYPPQAGESHPPCIHE